MGKGERTLPMIFAKLPLNLQKNTIWRAKKQSSNFIWPDLGGLVEEAGVELPLQV